MKQRKAIGYTSRTSLFSSKIICGECGGFYGSKVWHSTSKYRRTIWQCNQKFKNDDKCGTPHLYEDDLKRAFVDAFNSLMDNKKAILNGYEAVIHALTDNTALDEESKSLQEECDVVMELIHKYVDENAHSAINQDDYMTRYSALLERYETAKKKLYVVKNERQERKVKRENISGLRTALSYRG
jgi:site-specific DNA recombinase